MNDDSVHKPELPGVRTLEKDAPEEKSGFSFGGIKLTVPEKSTGANDDITAHKGGSLSGGKEVFDVERAFNDENVQEGTIVTDRKRKHMSAGAMLKSAWTEWWGNTKHSVETNVDKMEFLKPKEQPKIEVVEKRANIIQEAAQYAKQVPRDDHTIVVEKVRTYAHDAETITGKPFTIKEPAVKVGAHWAKPKEDAEVPAAAVETKPLPTLDLRSSVVANEVAHASTPLTQYVPKAEPQKPMPTPKVVVTEKPAIASLRTPEKMPGKKSAVEKRPGVWTFFKDEKKAPVDLRNKVTVSPLGMSVPRVESPTVPSTPRVREAIPKRTESVSRPTAETPVSVPPQEIPKEQQAIVQAKSLPEPIPTYVPRSTPEAPRATMLDHILGFITQVPRAFIITTIIIVGGGLGVLTALFVLSNADVEESTELAAPVVVPSFFDTDTEVPLPLGSTREVFYQSLINEMRVDHGTIVQYYPTITEGERTTPVTTDVIMRTLGVGAPGAFVRALSSDMMFGGVRTTAYAPFIVLRSTNFDVAFSGMLSWETHMASDLTPLFGTPPTEARFTDALESNRSIRILKDADGKEHIVYAFVTRDLIVITTNTVALSQIIERLQ